MYLSLCSGGRRDDEPAGFVQGSEYMLPVLTIHSLNNSAVVRGGVVFSEIQGGSILGTWLLFVQQSFYTNICTAQLLLLSF